MSNSEIDDEQPGASRDALRSFCAVGFRSDVDATALVLGRTSGEIRKMLDGEVQVDDDLEMKTKGISQERNFKL